MTKQKTVVTTFAGCGGSSLGYFWANCKVLLAIDFEEKAIQTYNKNFPDTKTWCKDIRDISGADILKEIGLKKGELDIFDGSPPCTPFSSCGIRDKGWSRSYKHGSESKAQRADDLFFEYIRIIKEIQPKMFIGENVAGMITGKVKGYFNDILRTMKGMDYDVQVFKVNAKDFQVPQSRPRIIFIGVRKDLAKPGLKPTLMTHKQISFAEAVKGVVNKPDELEKARKVAERPMLDGYFTKMKPGETAAKYHPKGSMFNYRRIHHNKPCPTITTTDSNLFHPFEDRALTVSELKRCSTFPDDFEFLSYRDGWLRIGNSVPPMLMKNIAEYACKLI